MKYVNSKLIAISALAACSILVQTAVFAEPQAINFGGLTEGSCDTLAVAENGELTLNISSSSNSAGDLNQGHPVPAIRNNKICSQTSEVVGPTPQPCILRYRVTAAACIPFNGASCNDASCALTVGTEYTAWDPACG